MNVRTLVGDPGGSHQRHGTDEFICWHELASTSLVGGRSFGDTERAQIKRANGPLTSVGLEPELLLSQPVQIHRHGALAAHRQPGEAASRAIEDDTNLGVRH